MLNPWYTTMMLASESCNVIALRMIKMSFGGQAALDEARLMLKEKVAASWEAGTISVGGGNIFGVIDCYRQHVAANAGRLVPKVAVKPGQSVTPSDDAVSLKAYELWINGGRTHGHDREDWLQAASACSPDIVVARRLS